MSWKKYDDNIKWRLGECSFMAKHNKAENNCSFLSIDYEEHPLLKESDLEPLGMKLLETVDEYLKGKSEFTIEQHSSSYHVLNRHGTIAKIWDDSGHNSQITNKRGAKKVAEKLVEYLERGSVPKAMPRQVSSCSDLPYVVERKGRVLARFRKKSEADKYWETCVINKHNQRIKDFCGKTSLINSRESGSTIDLFSGLGAYANPTAQDVLYSLRDYIVQEIEEVEDC